jgi:hypothetical protein
MIHVPTIIACSHNENKKMALVRSHKSENGKQDCVVILILSDPKWNYSEVTEYMDDIKSKYNILRITCGGDECSFAMVDRYARENDIKIHNIGFRNHASLHVQYMLNTT